MSDTTSKESSSAAGRSIEDWTSQAGFSRAKYFSLQPEFRPKSVKIGRRVVIIEAPAAWLQRMALVGGVPKREDKPKRSGAA